MKLKTFLLGTGAALAVANGAQAADLAMAEPVDYVKVCDAAGVGYWYIPGTDTCLKIGGWVREDVSFFDDSLVAPTDHSGNFAFATDTYLTATAKSMTDYGWLTGYIAWEGDYTTANANTMYVDEAYLSIGPLLAGKTASTYDYGGGFTYDGSDLDADNSHSQIRLSWAANGYGVMFGIEDPRYWTSGETDNLPDLIAAVTASQGPWDAKLSVGYADLVTGGGWGVQAAATIKLDQIAPGDAFRIKGAYAQDAWRFVDDGAGNGSGTAWSALASFQHFFTPQVYAAATFDYADIAGATAWQGTGQLTWLPVHNFQVGLEAGDTHVSTDTWWGKIRLQRDFGG